MAFSKETIDKILAYQPKLIRFLTHFKHLSPDQAEDVAQDCMLRVFKASARNKDEPKYISGYMQKVANNLLISAYRKSDFKKTDQLTTIEFEHDREKLLSALFSPLARSNPEACLELDEILKRVEAMGPKYSSVFFLYFYEGCSVEETGDILSVKTQTVKSRIHRIRQKLGRASHRDAKITLESHLEAA